jgi:quercetin dioxygenase-like cupin family protein
MRRTSIVATVVVFTTALSMATAFATPPTGDIKYTDLARSQTVDTASVPINGGTNLAMGTYSIAPGGETGWRNLPGPMVLAVTKGKMTVQGGDGCGTKEYPVGQAATVPAGTYAVHNTGSEPLQFFGAFFDQAPGAPKPLADGPTASPPASCSGVMAAAVGPTGVSLNSPSVGTVVTTFYSHHAILDIKNGKDLLAAHYEIAPGASTGWISHHPAINIVESGELSYAEAKDGKCDDSEVYNAGQAFYHPAHRHMAFNKGSEHVILWTMYFNLPHETPLPVIGNTITAVDFTQAPPADCPRLR